ncbi:MAG: hypothetical protein K2X82_05710 [Gemmataceae bacterium]|nr:hypothetical protein [Gemmataceae bacterium]
MPRRFVVLPLACVAALAGLVLLTPAAPAQPPANPGEGIKRSEEENLKLYKRFADELLKLAHRWEMRDNPDEKARAKTLRAALDLAEKHGVETLFRGLLGGIPGTTSGLEIQNLLAKDRALIKALEEIKETLETEDEFEKLKRDRMELEELVKLVGQLKREEETLRARTGVPKSDHEKIAKDQAELAKRTQQLAERMAKNDKSGKGTPKEPKDGPPSEPKDDTAESKPESKPGAAGAQPKPDKPGAKADGKGDGKPSEGKGGEAKPMPPSPGGGKPSDGPPSAPKPGKPGGGQPGGKRPPDPNNPNDPQRLLEEAVPPQDQAEENLKKNDREQASKNEDEAIKKLTDVLKELERRLKQLREKEMLRKLEDLERRVAKMLRMQVEVYEATKSVANQIKKNKGEVTSGDRQRSQIEGDKEGLIVEEANKALRVLEGEGTAVVFAGVLLEARKDMEAVAKQLLVVNVGPDTQLVEEQIIEQLKRMLEALKKAKEDLQNQNPSPPPGQPPGEQKKNLVQLVEQLKLLRGLQVQVNERTTAFGTRTPGEQANDPFIQEQLRQLGDRQRVFQNMLHKIAEQMNQQ